MPYVLTRVERDVLHVESALRDRELFPSAGARVQVAAPDLRSITVNHAADLRGETTASTLALTAHGSAEAVLALRVAQALDIDATGAAKLTLSGDAGKIALTMGGATSLTSSVITPEAEVVVTGTARVTIFASQRIAVRASGSASVIVRGRPTARDVQTSGSASVVYQD